MTQRGFTLTESLIVLTILSVLVSVAWPAINHFFKRHEAMKVVDSLQTLLSAGRAYALSNHRSLTLCGSSDSKRCDAVWTGGLLLLEDANRNGLVDGNDRILQFVALNIQPSQLVWRGFGGNKVIIERFGTTFASNGTFTYCWQDQDPLYRRQVVINRAGRVRKSQDRNRDGIHEDSSGQPISCP